MGSTKTKEIGVKVSDNVQENKDVKKNDSESTENTQKTTREPKVRGKQYKENKAKIDRQKLYKLSDAISLVKETDVASFNSTLEMHLVVKKEGTSVNVALPHSTGSKKKVELADEKTVAKLEKGDIDFDVLLATPEMMPKLVPFARILGPKGLMPNPKNGTLLKKAEDAKKFSLDKLNLKTERKAPVIHTTIGKKDMKDKELIENAEAIIKAVGPKQVLKCYLTASMSPSVKVAVE